MDYGYSPPSRVHHLDTNRWQCIMGISWTNCIFSATPLDMITKLCSIMLRRVKFWMNSFQAALAPLHCSYAHQAVDTSR